MLYFVYLLLWLAGENKHMKMKWKNCLSIFQDCIQPRDALLAAAGWDNVALMRTVHHSQLALASCLYQFTLLGEQGHQSVYGSLIVYRYWSESWMSLDLNLGLPALKQAFGHVDGQSASSGRLRRKGMRKIKKKVRFQLLVKSGR